MKHERDDRKFDFHDIGTAIKRVRERQGLPQEQLSNIIDRDPRTVMYHENDGQQTVYIGLDRHNLPHIRLGLLIMLQGIPALCRQLFTLRVLA